MPLGCAWAVHNIPSSTGTPRSSTATSTVPVDNFSVLTCTNAVIPGFHKPYYYDHREIPGNLVKWRGLCTTRSLTTRTP